MSSKAETLNRNSDFRRVYARGRSYTNPALVTYVKKNRAGICRFGITSSKKIGNAVERNRSRRLIRAAFRDVYGNHAEQLQGYDIIFVARVKTRFRKSTDLSKIMVKHLREAGLLTENRGSV